MHPLFTTEGKFNKGKFENLVWKPPMVKKFPIECWNEIYDSEMKLIYEINSCRLDDHEISNLFFN